MGLVLVSAPEVEPISLEEAKAHLRVSGSDDDAMIAIYIRAAREYCEGQYGFLGRALVTQTWRLDLDEFPTAEIKIPIPPLQGVNSIRYDDTAGAEQIVSTSDYYVDSASQPGWVVPVSSGWPSTLDSINTVRIEFVAGYLPDNTDSPPDLTANIPFNIKAGLLLMIGNMFENREDNVRDMAVNALPFGAEALLRPYRIQLPMA